MNFFKHLKHWVGQLRAEKNTAQLIFPNMEVMFSWTWSTLSQCFLRANSGFITGFTRPKWSHQSTVLFSGVPVGKHAYSTWTPNLLPVVVVQGPPVSPIIFMVAMEAKMTHFKTCFALCETSLLLNTLELVVGCRWLHWGHCPIFSSNLTTPAKVSWGWHHGMKVIEDKVLPITCEDI